MMDVLPGEHAVELNFDEEEGGEAEEQVCTEEDDCATDGGDTWILQIQDKLLIW